jgi:hypothetical protein
MIVQELLLRLYELPIDEEAIYDEKDDTVVIR